MYDQLRGTARSSPYCSFYPPIGYRNKTYLDARGVSEVPEGFAPAIVIQIFVRLLQ